MGTMESMETDGDDAMETACCEESVLRLLSLAALANQEDHVRKLEHVGIYAAKHEEGLSLPWQLVLFLSSLVADDKNHQTFPAECRSLSGIETNPFRSS